jgi:methylase of polypeptide subunit release factors
MTASYYKLSPEQIVEDIVHTHEAKKVVIKGLELLVHPNVYPSDRFRTTNFILDHLQPLLHKKAVCDMGCGLGVIGLFALEQGAKRVVQADINSLAVKNAQANRELHHYSPKRLEIYESDCFEQVPLQKFDLIVFNIPFHSEPYKISNPLEYAFHDPEFASTKKFLSQVSTYSHSETQIFIAFSNKGDVYQLENLFDASSLKWELWKVANANQEYDNRLYRLTFV